MVSPSLLGGYFTNLSKSKATTTYLRCYRAISAKIYSTIPMDILRQDGAVSKGGIGH
jgi:hypothetical protein